MSRQIRRLHRKKTDFTNFSSSEPSGLPNLYESSEHTTEKDSDNVPPLQPPLTSSSFAIGKNDINTIRAELREDTYHSLLAESDFTDDTHDWGGDSQSLSSAAPSGQIVVFDDWNAKRSHWHFVGSLE